MDNRNIIESEEALSNSTVDALIAGNIDIESLASQEEIKINIPLNSLSLLQSDFTSRFSSAVWYNRMRTIKITLAGLGGIGSYVAFLISRLKPSVIATFDGDTVDATNMSGQLYSSRQIGQSKAEATCELMRTLGGYYNNYAYARNFTEEYITYPVAICGFDNMEARKLFYIAWKSTIEIASSEVKRQALFIDGRLAAEEFQVFCMTGEDNFLMKEYEDKWLFDDSEAEETVCSYKQTSFCANMIASIMVNLLVNFVTNLCDPVIPRELPFLTQYDASTMTFRTKTYENSLLHS